MKKKILSIVLLFGLLISITGCGSNKDKIVGKWKNDTYIEGYEFVYTFNEDGTGKYDAVNTVLNFKYEIDGDKITFKYTDEEMEAFETTFSIDGDTLNIKDSDNEDVPYKRVK